MAAKYFTYIVRCRDGVLYTGYTNDINERINKHNRGEGAKFTRGRTPVELIYWEEYPTREEAMQREWAIKQLDRKQKLTLVNGGLKT
ncbi:GIY-YIG nuclease family protein [bacterium]|nr:MAG: GIY-YIG nuclease family protein [bacterium]